MCLLFLAGAMASWSSSAQARTSKCVQLERQLASLSSGNSGASGYQSAIRKQQRQISTVNRQLRSNRCTSRASSSSANCRKLKSLSSKMNRNLKALKARERKLSRRSGNSAAKRNRIQKSMRRNKCSQRSQRVARQGNSGILGQLFGSANSARNSRRAAYSDSRRGNNFNLLQQIFGGSRRGYSGFNDPSNSRNRRLDSQLWSTSRRYGNYNSVRTLCVRKCDGYYFPVSFSTDVSGIDDDTLACANLCPGQAMELYSHDTNNETPDQMRSTIDGTAYVDLELAYAYRESYNPSCACNHKLLDRRNNIDVPNSALKADYIRSVVPPPGSTFPKPRPTQSTVANLGGQIRLSRSPLYRSARDDRHVRVVGDEFFPSQ